MGVIWDFSSKFVKNMGDIWENVELKIDKYVKIRRTTEDFFR